MALNTLKKLSLNELITSLHDLISSFSRGLGKIIQRNEELQTKDLDELREHIRARLDAGEEKADNEKLLKLIDLLKDDKNAFDLMSKDVSEWLEFLDAIEEHVGEGVMGLGAGEQKKLQELKEGLFELKEMLRDKEK
jgi:hypothetical protein